MGNIDGSQKKIDGWMDEQHVNSRSLKNDQLLARHPLALHVKADALYHLGNFEHALVYYHRGLRFEEKNRKLKGL